MPLHGSEKSKKPGGHRRRTGGDPPPSIRRGDASSCPTLGGTIDALMMDLETGEFLIGEWKTSKRFNVDMPLQIAAYALLLAECRDIEVSGAIVVKCSKMEAQWRELNIGDPVLPKAKKEFVRRRLSHHYTQEIARFFGMG